MAVLRRSSRLQFRAEAAPWSPATTREIPTTLLFLTGGDTTVRGYSYRQIGTERDDGAIVAGRYLGVGSVEWQRPILWNGKLSDFESAVFVDAGSVADKFGELKAKVGTGVGVRWRSPVGPVQADVAYGVDTKKYRLHLRLGFSVLGTRVADDRDAHPCPRRRSRTRRVLRGAGVGVRDADRPAGRDRRRRLVVVGL